MTDLLEVPADAVPESVLGDDGVVELLEKFQNGQKERDTAGLSITLRQSYNSFFP